MLDVYGSRGLTLVRGEGATVWDAEGRSYLDCVGGHGALALGHRHPGLLAALRTQSELLWMTPGSFGNPARSALADALHQVLPPSLNKTFLSNSGAESVEAAIKFARLHTGRPGLVAADGGFHGRTMGALSITSEPRFREGFEPLLPHVRRVPFNDSESLGQVMDDTVAALILEPVQGERGVFPATAEYLQAARTACDDAGALLVFDEVQTGFGRTGKMFAFEHFGIVPDILCLSKSLASGLPLGATVVRSDIEVPIGAHGSTFGGNPIACAVAHAGISVLSDDALLSDADAKGRRLADRLRDPGLTLVKEVRQIGLMLAVQLRVRARPFLEQLQNRGVLVLSSGSRTLRLLPPLVITDEQIDQVATALSAVLAETP
ncbi:MAG: aspartate aminotransferase family protein [Gemmatimonadetes bacterium]|nr:aspartate aminotransferase family protein [Gemmatimonadota bacterium]